MPDGEGLFYLSWGGTPAPSLANCPAIEVEFLPNSISLKWSGKSVMISADLSKEDAALSWEFSRTFLGVRAAQD